MSQPELIGGMSSEGHEYVVRVAEYSSNILAARSRMLKMRQNPPWEDFPIDHEKAWLWADEMATQIETIDAYCDLILEMGDIPGEVAKNHIQLLEGSRKIKTSMDHLDEGYVSSDPAEFTLSDDIFQLGALQITEALRVIRQQSIVSRYNREN
jgi:hypothetical protein